MLSLSKKQTPTFIKGITVKEKSVQPVEVKGEENEDDGRDTTRLREEAARRNAERQLFEAVSYGNTATRLGEEIRSLAEKISQGKISRDDSLIDFAKVIQRLAFSGADWPRRFTNL